MTAAGQAHCDASSAQRPGLEPGRIVHLRPSEKATLTRREAPQTLPYFASFPRCHAYRTFFCGFRSCEMDVSAVHQHPLKHDPSNSILPPACLRTPWLLSWQVFIRCEVLRSQTGSLLPSSRTNSPAVAPLHLFVAGLHHAHYYLALLPSFFPKGLTLKNRTSDALGDRDIQHHAFDSIRSFAYCRRSEALWSTGMESARPGSVG